MEKIKIITDSTADLPEYILKKYDIEVLPLIINFGEESYRDGIDIDIYTLFNKMENSSIFPATAQVNPQVFLDCYSSYIKKGYKIISIHLSSKMSGTYQSACIAKETLKSEDIVVIDSMNVTSGLGIQVIKAAKLKGAGLGIKEIENEVKKISPHIKSTLAFNSLDNLVRGGRLSKTAGVIGNILGIKIIVEVKDGEMSVVDKVRGSKKVLRSMLTYLDQRGIKSAEDLILLHVGEVDILDSLRENLNEKKLDFIECEVGCTVGVHSGSGACGVFFVEDY
ncbi:MULTISPECIES: DegV family protein [Clostridium]|uniref:DegV domain-containing protein n=3 Tax=Clostridium TaxID=1485 RepID=D8GUR6_CLOLD|nr:MULTISPECIES: DegV family protein [Clostridium]ADK16943.1 putative degV protein [Clostridium ljungdahlii DSM 13528]AGY75982.1 DegV family protein [Clostridium autoethanogenum DSM 10061]ALU36146.1 DegV family protein [Clostridium autoethanogenum DSM 10061]OAA85320.1 DegV domain-containing protein [Clostridium ljungdahlii DSM 13528]OVY51796.1 DegV domain-containing protein [Clostridium autoethanogenum]